MNGDQLGHYMAGFYHAIIRIENMLHASNKKDFRDYAIMMIENAKKTATPEEWSEMHHEVAEIISSQIFDGIKK